MLLIMAVGFLAWSNGANDNFKGVASLFGSRTTSYRTAITWATVTTFAGSLCFAEDKPPGPPPGGPEGKGGRPHANPDEAFKKLDANSDGGITLDEFKAGPRGQKDPARAEAAYKKIDKDGDGKVTLEEFKTGHPQRPGGPGGDAPGGKGGKRGKGPGKA